jgi:tetratricopeptide (TPR) repeat protein
LRLRAWLLPALLPVTAALADTPDPLALLQAGKRQDALAAAESVIATNPDDPTKALYLSALINLEDGNWQAALPRAEALLKLRPGTFLALEIAVQAYAAAGDTAKRDAAIGSLFRVWRASADPSVHARRVFARDRIIGPKRKLVVLQTLQTGGGDIVRYIFQDAGSAAQQDRAIMLRADSETTQRWRDDGTVPDDATVFHLDSAENPPGGDQTIRTYAFYIGEPDYDRVRAKVVEILAGKALPLTGAPDPYWADP